jgi:hypothetical protein
MDTRSILSIYSITNVSQDPFSEGAPILVITLEPVERGTEVAAAKKKESRIDAQGSWRGRV